jgi:hypothetical protein
MGCDGGRKRFKQKQKREKSVEKGKDLSKKGM